MSGKHYISKSVADMLGDDSYADENTSSNALPQVDKLSRRELDIFRLIGEGRSRSEIAEVLDISTKTVETHRANIKYKLNAASASDLKKYANEWLRIQLNNN
jgi:DNA-binding NarL/FixJ family response regulator